MLKVFLIHPRKNATSKWKLNRNISALSNDLLFFNDLSVINATFEHHLQVARVATSTRFFDVKLKQLLF